MPRRHRHCRRPTQEDTADSLRKLFAGELRGALALLLLLAVAFGAVHHWMHKLLTRLYGALVTRLLSNLQLVAAWLVAVAIFYGLDSDPILHGLGECPVTVVACIRVIIMPPAASTNDSLAPTPTPAVVRHSDRRKSRVIRRQGRPPPG